MTYLSTDRWSSSSSAVVRGCAGSTWYRSSPRETCATVVRAFRLPWYWYTALPRQQQLNHRTGSGTDLPWKVYSRSSSGIRWPRSCSVRCSNPFFLLEKSRTTSQVFCLAKKKARTCCEGVKFYGAALNEAESPVITGVHVLGSYL